MSRTQLSYQPHNIAIRLLSASYKQCACKYLEYIRTFPLRASCWIGGNKLDLMQFHWNHNSSIFANHNVSCIKWIESHEPCLNFNPREFIFNVFVLGSSMIESGIFSLESNSKVSGRRINSPAKSLFLICRKDWNKYAKSWKIMQHKGLNKQVAVALTTLMNFLLSNTRCLISSMSRSMSCECEHWIYAKLHEWWNVSVSKGLLTCSNVHGNVSSWLAKSIVN